MESKIRDNVAFFQPGFYYAPRDDKFKTFIISLLQNSKLKTQYIDQLVNSKNIKIFESAFTSDIIDIDNNYQHYEQIGDGVCNLFVVEYFYKRFPFLQSPAGVTIIARLKMIYSSKQILYKVGKKIGLYEFISAPNEFRTTKSLIEDVFEAFIGSLKVLVDEEIYSGTGYAICSNILTHIFDQEDVSLKYEDLYDSKTILKETFDMFKLKIGKQPIYEQGVYNQSNHVATSTVYFKDEMSKQQIKIGEGYGGTVIDSEQAAAKMAISTLAEKYKIQKPTPQIFHDIEQKIFVRGKLIQPISDQRDVSQNLVNVSYSNHVKIKTKGKTQIEYQATPISYACKRLDVEKIRKLLDMGANPYIPDVFGLMCFDLIFTNLSQDHNKIEAIFKLFYDRKIVMYLHKNIFDYFYTQLDKNKFDKYVSNVKFIDEKQERIDYEKRLN